MVSLYVKGKENGHVQAYAPTGAMGLKRWGGLTSKLDGLPIASDPHLWWQACPWRKSLSRKIALTRIKFYGRKLQVKAFQTAFGQSKDALILCAFGAILCPGNFRHGQALPHRLSLRATMKRKPVHDFPFPFTHCRSLDYTKWNNIPNPRKISIEPHNPLVLVDRTQCFRSWRVYVGFYIFPALLRLYSVGVTP